MGGVSNLGLPEREQRLPEPALKKALVLQLKYRSLKITVNAALQRQFHSPFIFREEDPSRQVSSRESKTGRGGMGGDDRCSIQEMLGCNPSIQEMKTNPWSFSLASLAPGQ